MHVPSFFEILGMGSPRLEAFCCFDLIKKKPKYLNLKIFGHGFTPEAFFFFIHYHLIFS